MAKIEKMEMRLRVDVSPRATQFLNFAARHPWLFRWMGVDLLAWLVVRLGVRVRPVEQ